MPVFYLALRAAKGDVMILSTGKNDFLNNMFDRFRWSANTYETPEEIIAYLRELGVFNKKISAVSAIGSVRFLSVGNWKYRAIDKLKEAGIVTKAERYERVRKRLILCDGDVCDSEDCLDLLKNVSVSRCACLCEPLLILFEDGNVLELLPRFGIGLRIGYNTLPKEMQDGVNRCEYDIGILFNPCVSGRKLAWLEVFSTVETSVSNIKDKGGSSAWNEYHFYLRDGYMILKELSSNSVYELTFSEYENIRCEDLAELPEKNYQTAVFEGLAGGGSVSIYPVREIDTDRYDDYEKNYDEAISVCYEEPELFLHRLRKRFDASLPLNQKHAEGHFHSYSRNFYTKDSVLQMIEKARKDLEEVWELPMCEKVKRLECGRRGTTEEEKIIWIEEELSYTERFLNRLQGMAENTPGYDYILFEGP